MRLLNTSTELLEEFIDTSVPPYAILSHTWGDGEVSLKDMTTDPAYKSKLGYTKISMTCQLAREDGLQYAWIDTCCIDKSSSAELSEAINSMYQWYKKAEKCYAYLFDLDSTPTWRKRLPQCRWFSRGWTLQELIAPMDVWFYDGKWNLVFRKGEDSHLLKRITGIHQDVLKGSRSMLSMSIAQRMSWASRRVTTRAEDEAYCLLGIFDVNMPMLYGEGRKAFFRLQEEIIRISPDLSIFAWTSKKPPGDDEQAPVACSMFASATDDFAESGTFVAVNAQSTNDFSISNQGIKVHTRLALQKVPRQQGYRYVMKVCKTIDGRVFGIRLRKCGVSQLVREDPWVLIGEENTFPSMQSRIMYLLNRLPPAHAPNYLLESIVLGSRSRVLQIDLPPEMYINNVWPWSRWDVTDQTFFVSDDLGLDCAGFRVFGGYDFDPLRRGERSKFSFMVYVWKWSRNGDRPMTEPEFTLVPWTASDTSLKDLNEKLEQYEYNSTMLQADFETYRVRVAKNVHFPFEKRRLVSARCAFNLVNDWSKCSEPFWKMTLFVEASGDGF
ncbi:HET protein [Glarea lozoyensis ATCC 20868]|uniref:HET protein n=1 Tax=Glarea lozoyensis (strain ATCC 20868 / MF5171) TaxID=1116229 RepID=S3D6T8_GLAL2|nr:HET protein [Glarea lozoyensis ATCC 20868]EPE33500.1 HET protein [Glarea lozoyensis ATCC 20868]